METDNGTVLYKVIVPGDGLWKIGGVLSAELDEPAEADDSFLEIAADEECAEEVNVLGGTGDAEGFGRVFLLVGVHPARL